MQNELSVQPLAAQLPKINIPTQLKRQTAQPIQSPVSQPTGSDIPRSWQPISHDENTANFLAENTLSNTEAHPSFLSSMMSGASNFGKAVAGDAVKTLLVNPLVKTKQALTGLNQEYNPLSNQNQLLKAYDEIDNADISNEAKGILYNQARQKYGQWEKPEDVGAADVSIGGLGKVEKQESGLKGWEQIAAQGLKAAAYLAPYGKLGQLAGKGATALGAGAKVAGVVGKSAAGGAMGYTSDVAAHLTDDKVRGLDNLKPGFGTLVGTSLPIATSAIGAGLKHLSGWLSGSGAEAVDYAYNNPDKTLSAIKNATKQNPKELLAKFDEALADISKQRGAAFKDSLNALGADDVATPKELKKAFGDALSNFGLSFKKGELVGDTSLTDSEINTLQKLYNKLSNWSDFSPQGLQTYKNALTNEMGRLAPVGKSTVGDAALTSLKKMLDEKLSSVTGYSEMNSNYGLASEFIDDLRKEIGVGGNAADSTKMTKILNAFKNDNSLKTELLQKLGNQTGKDVYNQIIGQIFSKWLPANALRDLSIEGGSAMLAHTFGLSNPVSAGIAGGEMALSSPKLVGTGAAMLGKLSNTPIPEMLEKSATVQGLGLRQQSTQKKSTLKKVNSAMDLP